MRIGNFKPNTGEQLPLDKWLWCIHILKCSPYKFPKYIFKPYIYISFKKFIEFGERGKFNSKEDVKKGGFIQWESPIGLYCEIRLIK